jgi:hypothetical protein
MALQFLVPDVCSVLMVAIFLVAVNPTGVDKKQGDAFVESPVDFFNSSDLVLEKYQEGPSHQRKTMGCRQ